MVNVSEVTTMLNDFGRVDLTDQRVLQECYTRMKAMETKLLNENKTLKYQLQIKIDEELEGVAIRGID